MNFIELFADYVGPMVNRYNHTNSVISAVYKNGFSVFISEKESYYFTNRDRPGPFTVFIPNLSTYLPFIRPGSAIIFWGAIIRIPDLVLSINLTQSKEWVTQPIMEIASSKKIIQNIQFTIETAMPLAENRSEAYEVIYSLLTRKEISHTSGIHNLSHQKFSQAFNILLNTSPIVGLDSIINTARSLLGFGHGSTPSGDDVVVGMLSVYKLAGKYFGLAQEHQDLLFSSILDNIGKNTNSLSASLLWAAVQGEVDGILRSLIVKMISAKIIGVHDIKELTSVGFSSGLDALTGVVISLLSLTKETKQRSRFSET